MTRAAIEGVFRSRDLRAAWLSAVSLFLNAALVVAGGPRDSSDLFVGTIGILVRATGGGAGCRRRAISSSVRYLRLPSHRTATPAACAAATACFVATRTVGYAPRPRTPRSRHEHSSAARNDRFYLRPKPVVLERARRPHLRGRARAPADERDDSAGGDCGVRRHSGVGDDGRAMMSRDAGRTWSDAGFGGADAPVDMIATDVTWPNASGRRRREGWWSAMISAELAFVGRSLPEPKPECAVSRRAQT